MDMSKTSYHFLTSDRKIIYTCHAANTAEAIAQWNGWIALRPHYRVMLTTLLRIDSNGQWEEVTWS